MTISEVKKLGSPILRKTITKLDKIPHNFQQTIHNMFLTMTQAKGIGLSANQVGLDQRFFIVDFGLYDEQFGKKVFVNPEITSMEGTTIDEEGCLSLPGINEKVSRANKIHIKFKDENFTDMEEDYDGYLSRVIQHEYDHLNGVVFTDRISSLKKSFIKNKLVALEQETKKEQGIL